jgi:hypothetical protein
MLILKKPQNLTTTSSSSQAGQEVEPGHFSIYYLLCGGVCVGSKGSTRAARSQGENNSNFLHTQIAGKFFVMNQSLSFSLSPPLSRSLSYVFFIFSPAIYSISTFLVLHQVMFFFTYIFLIFFFILPHFCEYVHLLSWFLFRPAF